MTRRQSKSRRESKAKILRQSSKIDPTLAVGVEGQLIQEEALEKGSVRVLFYNGRIRVYVYNGMTRLKFYPPRHGKSFIL